MADVEVVIKIPEVSYIATCNRCMLPIDVENVVRGIKNSIVLPKGHGDLIDRNKIEYLKAIHDLKWGKITANECATKIRHSAPTIIEADPESEG